MGLLFRLCATAMALLCAVSCQARDSSVVGDRQLAQQEETLVASRPTDPRSEDVLRSLYYQCAERSDGSTWVMQGCIEEEFEYQDARLNSTYIAVLNKVTDAENRRLREEQRRWLAGRDQGCEWDADAEGQAQRIDSNACALKKTAERAAQLEQMLQEVSGS